MGGLAIKQVIGKEGERLTREDVKLYTDIINFSLEKDYHLEFPVEVQEKESFGDIDILLCAKNNNSNFDYIQEVLRNAFKDVGKGYQGYHKNSNVYSLAINDKQIDLLFISHDEMYSAKSYLSNNDLGNLVGRIAHSLGLKYGHDGLTYLMRFEESNHIVKEINLSKDPAYILEFLGFEKKDIMTYLDYLNIGFSTFEELFEWVTRSKYFDGSKYDLNELNAINRVRNVKRTTYMNFISYLDSNPEKKNKKPDYLIYKSFFQMEALKLFNKQKDYFDAVYSKIKHDYTAKKFNGEIAKEIFGLEKQNLGEFLKKFFNKISKEDLFHLSLSKIKEESENLYKEMKDNGEFING